MPSAQMALPRRAVFGDDSSLSPTMNRTAATRYVTAITSPMLRVGSAFMRATSLARSRRASEHSQHTIGHEEPADHVDRRQCDRSDAEYLVVRRRKPPGDEDRTDH